MTDISPILEGYSVKEDVERDMLRIDGLLEREREWYQDAARFRTSSEILGAVSAGDLVVVGGDDNVSLIRRFRNPSLHHRYGPFLTPQANDMLTAIGEAWREEADTLHVAPEVRLAITSLVRSRDYQKEIVAANKLGVADSTHPTGNTFDLDMGGYFTCIDGQEASVSLREPGKAERIAGAFETELGVSRSDPLRFGPEAYDPRVAEALDRVARVFHDKGVINYVPEMRGTPNTVAHISVAPLSQAA